MEYTKKQKVEIKIEITKPCMDAECEPDPEVVEKGRELDSCALGATESKGAPASTVLDRAFASYELGSTYFGCAHEAGCTKSEARFFASLFDLDQCSPVDRSEWNFAIEAAAKYLSGELGLRQEAEAVLQLRLTEYRNKETQPLPTAKELLRAI
jgi:hypothetical protein